MELLENAVSKAPEPANRFLQVAGIRFKYCDYKPVGEKIIPSSVFVFQSSENKNFPLDTNEDYKICSVSWVADGNGGYECCKKWKWVNTKKVLSTNENLISTSLNYFLIMFKSFMGRFLKRV